NRTDQRESAIHPAAHNAQLVATTYGDESPGVPAPVETREQAAVIEARPQRVPRLPARLGNRRGAARSRDTGGVIEARPQRVPRLAKRLESSGVLDRGKARRRGVHLGGSSLREVIV